MDLSRYNRTHDVVRGVAERRISIDQADEVLADLLWDVHPEDDPNSVRLGAALLLLIAERDKGHRDDESVIRESDQLSRNQTIYSVDAVRARAEASGQLLKHHIKVRISSPFDAAQLNAAAPGTVFAH